MAKVVLRKIVVTAKNRLKRSFEGNQIKIKVTRWLERAQFDAKQTKTYFLCYKVEWNVF